MNRRLFLKRAGQAFGVIAVLPALGSAGKLIAKGSHEEYYEHTILAMGTTARVGIYAKNEAAANKIITPVLNELKRLEALFSVYEDSSEVSKINNAGGKPVVISADTFGILRASLAMSKLTESAFDVTVEPLMRLWGFRNEVSQLERLPTEDEIRAALAVVGSKQIKLDLKSRTAMLHSPLAKLDLGGIAVGYALDRMKAMLVSAGVRNAFIDISGDVIAMGKQHGKLGWHIAIPDPNRPGVIIKDMPISDKALATSGSYMNFVVYQAQHYGHIMNPHEGRSADRILSATCIANTGIQADALSTGSFVTGTKYKGGKYVFVSKDGSVS